MPDSFNYYQDPAHGWVEVPEVLVRKLNMHVTTYSYVNAGMVYLEEDQDLTTFMHAYGNAYGHAPDLIEVHQDHTPIRRYARWTA